MKQYVKKYDITIEVTELENGREPTQISFSWKGKNYTQNTPYVKEFLQDEEILTMLMDDVIRKINK